MSTIIDMLRDKRWLRRRPRRIYIVMYGFGRCPEVFATKREALAAQRDFRKVAWDVDTWIVRYDWRGET